MRPKKKFVLKEISLNSLTLEDVFCIACRCIYIQPVTMPCGHTLCLECFKNMVNLTAYQCPTCRTRISNWLRKYKNNWEALVNQKFWKALQLQYPVEVQKKLNNEDDGIEERITSNGFTRVEIQEGEIKKEFDSMITNFQEEQKQKELQDLKLANELQEAEEVNNKITKAANEELTKNDVHLALTIQENIQKEEENNRRLALILQEKEFSSEFKETKADIVNKTLKTSSKKLPKKGPLDKMFAKSLAKNSEALYSSTKYGDMSSSSNSSLSNKSSFSSDFCTSSSVTYSSINSLDLDQFDDDSVITCSCGRLKDSSNSTLPPCNFCSVQIALLDKISIQNKNDFLMAKKLQETFHKEHFEDYNLRKRSANPLQRANKIPKKQQTLIESFNKSYKN